MIKCDFNDELQVLEVIYEGDISADEILEHARFIAENKNLPRKLNILTDARNAHYKFKPKETRQILKFLKQSVKKYEFIKDAFIHKAPRETAYSMTIEFNQQHPNYEHKVFSTKQAALIWLQEKL